MREIKFRAWREQVNRFRFFDISTGFNVENADVFTSVEQFTGLLDKNGVEIYEGDIVESDFYLPDIASVAEIKYNNGLMRFVFDSGEQDAFEYGNLAVIGNIHQNKELLK